MTGDDRARWLARLDGDEFREVLHDASKLEADDPFRLAVEAEDHDRAC